MSKPSDIRPVYYGGPDNPYEVIKVAEDWGWGYQMCMGTALKYLARCGKKDGEDLQKDLTKARWYVERATTNRPGSVTQGVGVHAKLRVTEVCAAHGLRGDLAEAVKYLRQNDPETALRFVTAALGDTCAKQD